VNNDCLVDAEDLRMSFGARRVLDGVSLRLAKGDCVGLVGENGAGKTTLLRILVGLLQPASGVVWRRGRVGYCPQEALVFDGLTVEENLEFFGAGYGLPRERQLASSELLMRQLNFAHERGTPSAQLSGGTRQKLNLAIGLLARPDVLILDEPYAAFDWETYLRFWDLAAAMRSEGRAVLIVSHFVFERDRFDRVLELRDGRLHQAEVH
jgi:ABC-type multidrug transport system ATPase subunit